MSTTEDRNQKMTPAFSLAESDAPDLNSLKQTIRSMSRQELMEAALHLAEQDAAYRERLQAELAGAVAKTEGQKGSSSSHSVIAPYAGIMFVWNDVLIRSRSFGQEGEFTCDCVSDVLASLKQLQQMAKDPSLSWPFRKQLLRNILLSISASEQEAAKVGLSLQVLQETLIRTEEEWWDYTDLIDDLFDESGRSSQTLLTSPAHLKPRQGLSETLNMKKEEEILSQLWQQVKELSRDFTVDAWQQRHEYGHASVCLEGMRKMLTRIPFSWQIRQPILMQVISALEKRPQMEYQEQLFDLAGYLMKSAEEQKDWQSFLLKRMDQPYHL